VPEGIALVPRDGDSQPERPNIAPASIDFMGEAKRFDIQINFAVK
jgi:hypothetical protein